MSKTKTEFPEQKHGEMRKEYRIRVVAWIIQNHPGLVYDEIVSMHKELTGTLTSKESIVRDIGILEVREEVYTEASETDKRMKQWYACDE